MLIKNQNNTCVKQPLPLGHLHRECSSRSSAASSAFPSWSSTPFSVFSVIDTFTLPFSWAWGVCCPVGVATSCWFAFSVVLTLVPFWSGRCASAASGKIFMSVFLVCNSINCGEWNVFRRVITKRQEEKLLLACYASYNSDIIFK